MKLVLIEYVVFSKYNIFVRYVNVNGHKNYITTKYNNKTN